MRVLHIVESLGRNAVETWLLRMLEHARRKGISCDWTFYTQLTEEGENEGQAIELGAKVIRSPVPLKQKYLFSRSLHNYLKTGAYDVVHGHHDILNGYYFLCSKGCGIRRKICHIHNADENVPVKNRFKARLFRNIFRFMALRESDRIVGISDHTLDRFLCGKARLDGRDKVHYYGVNVRRWCPTKEDRNRFRKSLGLPSDSKIILFGGRLVPEKNPDFALDVFADYAYQDSNSYLLFVGAGGLEDGLKERTVDKNLSERVRFLGWRNDVFEIMGLSDLFFLARPEEPPEGFGLAVIEAQLAGLPLLISKGVRDDPILDTAIYRRLSLYDPIELWVSSMQGLLYSERPSLTATWRSFEASPMQMDRALDDLLQLYEGLA